jgi:hypothetical protein
MTAQKLAGRPLQIFDAQRLRDELHHPHPTRRAAAYEAARWILALATDRHTFFEGTRADVWANIFNMDRLQRDIDSGTPSRMRPADPMRSVGALLVVEALERVIALRSSGRLANANDQSTGSIATEEFTRVCNELDRWMSEGEASCAAA